MAPQKGVSSYDICSLWSLTFENKQICKKIYKFARGISLLRKSVRDFSSTKGFLRIFDGFFWQTKGFLPKAYEIFWSEMPLANLKQFATIRRKLFTCFGSFVNKFLRNFPEN